MSKVIKQMQMDALADTFQGVRDLVVLGIKGLTAQADNQLRAALRKKKIRLKMVKNTYTRRVFDELGIRIPADSPYWSGTTVLAWGAGSVSELSRAIDTELKAPKTAAQYKDRVRIKGAIVDGMPTKFEDAIKMPTLRGGRPRRDARYVSGVAPGRPDPRACGRRRRADQDQVGGENRGEPAGRRSPRRRRLTELLRTRGCPLQQPQ